MEQLIVTLVVGFINALPAIIEAINKSTTIPDAEKSKLLFDLHLRLMESVTKVSAVRFRDIDNASRP